MLKSADTGRRETVIPPLGWCVFPLATGRTATSRRSAGGDDDHQQPQALAAATVGPPQPPPATSTTTTTMTTPSLLNPGGDEMNNLQAGVNATSAAAGSCRTASLGPTAVSITAPSASAVLRHQNSGETEPTAAVSGGGGVGVAQDSELVGEEVGSAQTDGESNRGSGLYDDEEWQVAYHATSIGGVR